MSLFTQQLEMLGLFWLILIFLAVKAIGLAGFPQTGYIYSTHGHYVGWLAEGPRILRKQEDGYTRPKIDIIPPFTLKISATSIISTTSHDA